MWCPGLCGPSNRVTIGRDHANRNSERLTHKNKERGRPPPQLHRAKSTRPSSKGVVYGRWAGPCLFSKRLLNSTQRPSRHCLFRVTVRVLALLVKRPCPCQMIQVKTRKRMSSKFALRAYQLNDRCSLRRGRKACPLPSGLVDLRR